MRAPYAPPRSARLSESITKSRSPERDIATTNVFSFTSCVGSVVNSHESITYTGTGEYQVNKGAAMTEAV